MLDEGSPFAFLILDEEARVLEVGRLARLCVGDGEKGVKVVESTLDMMCDRLDRLLASDLDGQL